MVFQNILAISSFSLKEPGFLVRIIYRAISKRGAGKGSIAISN